MVLPRVCAVCAAVYALVSFLRRHVTASQFRNIATTFAVVVVAGFGALLLFLQVRCVRFVHACLWCIFNACVVQPPPHWV